MPNKFAISIALIWIQASSFAAEPIQFIQIPTIYISNTTDLKVNPDAQTTFESFVRNWSQFEILVDKNLFPISAPNCREKIQIRFKGIEPVKDLITPIQQSRWRLLEQIRSGNSKNDSAIFLKIDTRHYIQKNADGRYELQYCNVFVE